MSRRLATVVGARPQFIKAAVLSPAFSAAGVEEVLVHTGQHYDREMDSVFFEELDLPPVNTNLGIGSGSQADQTARIMVALEDFLLGAGQLDCLVVFGDTNSTLAGALVAAKVGLPIAHVEAGLRSFDQRMPEEINRIVTDRLSKLLFAPTQTAADLLVKEGHTGNIVLSGDVMLDAVRTYSARATRIESHQTEDYYLATVHRAANTDQKQRLGQILEAFGALDAPVLFPVHPRTSAPIAEYPLAKNIILMEPVGYVKMLRLVQDARCVLTDSGGLQKEAYWLGTPCITLRDETEWVETLSSGWNQLAGADTRAIIEAVARVPAPGTPRPAFGESPDGNATKVIVESILAGCS